MLRRWRPRIAARLVPTSLLAITIAGGFAAAAPDRAGTSHARELRPQQRWLVRLELQRLPVVVAGVDGKQYPLQLWSTRAGNEYLVQHQRRLYLVDTRQGRLFQLPEAVHEQLARSFELLFPYPVPLRDAPVDGPTETFQLPGPGLELGKTLLPADSLLASILNSNVGGTVLMPNVDLREYREVYRIAFVVGGNRLELFLDKKPE